MKILTNLTKIHNSIYALIPTKLSKSFEGDKQVLIDFQKYEPVLQRMAKDFKRLHSDVEVIYNNKNSPSVEGMVQEVTQEYVIIFDGECSHQIPFSLISNILSPKSVPIPNGTDRLPEVEKFNEVENDL